MFDEFDPARVFGMAAPLFVRKVETASDCGRDEQILEHRVSEILREVLRLDEDGCLSVYLVEDSEGLARVAFAVNEAFRRSVSEKLFLVPFSINEVANIPRAQTDGGCLCTFVKKRHYDLKPTDEQRKQLAETLAQAGRRPAKLGDKLLKRTKSLIHNSGCRSVSLGSNACVCD